MITPGEYLSFLDARLPGLVVLTVDHVHASIEVFDRICGDV